MTPVTALFPRLLGEQWQQLPAPVRRLHGDAPRVMARGMADVQGATHWPAHLLRRLLGLPDLGAGQALEVTIEREGSREIWTRRFASGRMRSVLDHHAGDSLLREQLGPVTLYFRLHRQGEAIDWQLHRATAYGVPLPRRIFGRVVSRSGAKADRYVFLIDTHLPLLGRLVGYRGWLEMIDDS